MSSPAPPDAKRTEALRQAGLDSIEGVFGYTGGSDLSASRWPGGSNACWPTGRAKAQPPWRLRTYAQLVMPASRRWRWSPPERNRAGWGPVAAT